ncbi:hypothetical protein E2C01_073993 [Portunus trituberculatus]|uniref:Uncharacterized protein n=1 Tax=Portunus trituberculatus TaxID=210409 RepID=A0A5B7IFK0_PORTR|nr:hypothetical protein [Portunus trituberculatus]
MKNISQSDIFPRHVSTGSAAAHAGRLTAGNEVTGGSSPRVHSLSLSISEIQGNEGLKECHNEF